MGITYLLLSVIILIGESLAKPRKTEFPPEFSEGVPQKLQFFPEDGDKFKLRCKVTGHPRPFLIWYKDGKKLSTHYNERYKITRFALTIDPIYRNDTGKYSCHASNILGEILGNFTVNVTDVQDYHDDYFGVEDCDVEGKPTWKREKTNNHHKIKPTRESVEFKCQSCGTPTPEITWYKKDQQITVDESDHGRYQIKANGQTLRMDNLSKRDNGDYRCVVKNKHGNISWTYTLEIIGKKVFASPGIIKGPRNVTTYQGENVTLECRIDESIRLTSIQWLRHYTVNDSYLSPEGEPYVTVLQSRSSLLELYSVTSEDSGWYTCLVSNPFGRHYLSAWLNVKVDAESQRTCRDWNNTIIQHGDRFSPRESQPCYRCECDNGNERYCRNVYCDKPPCRGARPIPGTCCGFICPVERQPELEPEPSNKDCPEGWTKHEDKCYYVSRDKLSWASSQVICKSINGKLVEITSEEENSFLKDLTLSEGVINYWIGVTDIEVAGTYKFPGKATALEYTDWKRRSPPKHKTYNCVEVKKARVFHWKPTKCTKRINFVCQRYP